MVGPRQAWEAEAWRWLEEELDLLLASVSSPLVGVTTLLPGAEQRFARCVLGLGGQLHVVVPFVDHERELGSAEEVAAFRALLAEARVEPTPRARPGGDAGAAARRRVVDLSDELIVVWNGAPAAGPGDVAAQVTYAFETHVPLVQLNPQTRKSERLR
jgi:hypothetical protein